MSVDAATKKAQADASNPASSAWVSANAGAGKTFVLARRVVRLLLAGADPGHILCLTFTKAAAAEMSKRVFDLLAGWTRLNDAALSKELAEIEGRRPSSAKLAAARRVFARALETPGGLKIQTIHAFCERLLHQFPFEANVPGHFEVLDERNSAALADAARRSVLAAAARDREGPLGRALQTVLAAAGDFIVEQTVKTFVDQRDRIRRWIVAANTIDNALRELRGGLGLAPGETADSLRAKVLGECILIDELDMLVERLATGGKNDRAAAERLRLCTEAVDDDERITAYLRFWRTQDGKELRKPGSLVTNAVKREIAGLEERLVTEHARLEALIDRWNAAECYESTEAMLRLSDAAIIEYERLKRERGALDFEDLIVKTADLLKRVDASRWVHYKLDRGLDHILVDEAQDTNPRQWEVIETLASEFFAGEGAHEGARTLFAVGDEKQSIFSFQGAVPTRFASTRRKLGTAASAAGLDWKEPSLHLSFRSVPKVLDAVDTVFAVPARRKGLSSTDEQPSHTANRRDQPGRVIIWPMVEPAERREPPDWSTPIEATGEKRPEDQLADRIARTIKGWRASRERLDAGKRPLIRPGSILILSRIRGVQTDAINRALKSADIEIAGADRLVLTEHIAVMDLIALGRVMLLPEDDLSLAALLKSPLIGFDEDDLFAVAHDRGKRTLYRSLGRLAEERGGKFAEARGLIDGWRSLADRIDPYAFFARVLGPDGGRRRFLARLGSEAEDVLDEFLVQALEYEKSHVPSLEGFLSFLTSTPIDIRRDTDTDRDEVRVMTVHGAKGLEADIVFLVDTGAQPANAGHDPRIVALRDDREGVPAPLVWMRGMRSMPRLVRERVEAFREDTRDEYRRLLYVGLTRAKDRLYICGTRKQNVPAGTIWHDLVTEALGDKLTPIATPEGEALEWRAEEWKLAIPKDEQREMTLKEPRPAWLSRSAPAAPPERRSINPSTALADERAPFYARARSRPGTDPESAAALERGQFIHRLLQSLPDIAPEQRAPSARQYLDAVAPKWPEADREALLTEVLAILDDPRFAPVFAPGSRAEIDVASLIPADGAEALSGRIDRLAVTGDRVLIVDYKTNRPAPATLSDTPQAYIAQLALYRQLMRRLYPAKGVAAAILWTDSPALLEIPSTALDEALAKVAGT